MILAAASAHGLLVLLVWVLVALVVLGVIWYVASQLLPPPIPLIAVLITGIVILLWLTDSTA